MSFDAAMAIRVGSASLFVLLGLAIAIVGRKVPRVIALGVILAIFGLLFVSNNLAREFGWEAYVLRGAQNLVTAAAAAASAFVLPRFIGVRSWRPAAYALVISVLTHPLRLMATDFSALLTLLGFQGAPAELMPFLRIVASSLGFATSIMLASMAAAVAIQPPTSPRHWRIAAALSCVLGIWGVLQLSTLSMRPLDPLAFTAELLFVLSLAVPWLVAAWRSGEPFAACMALVWPTIGLLSYLYFLVPGAAEALYDPWGMLGVTRLLGWGILVYAIAKHDLLGVPLPHFVVRRGAIAGSALALLFIVAQVAQNFFSAEFGLLSGGIIAGTFLFAASPIQKSIERMGERKTPARSKSATTPHAGKQQAEAFRGAVRLAWKDRRFDQSEELALAVLADSMGLSAERATAIRHEVEREKGAA